MTSIHGIPQTTRRRFLQQTGSMAAGAALLGTAIPAVHAGDCASGAKAAKASNTIVDTAVSAGSFTTLVAVPAVEPGNIEDAAGAAAGDRERRSPPPGRPPATSPPGWAFGRGWPGRPAGAAGLLPGWAGLLWPLRA